MANPFTVMAVISSVVGFAAKKQAQAAANAQSKNQQNHLERAKENQRQALVENSKRQQQNKERQLAQIRVGQAASGFNTDGGTPLSIFGDIETRMDEQINEQMSSALDAIGNTESQIKNLQFGDKIRSAADKMDMVAFGVESAAKFGSGYTANYDRTGSDPFGVFSKSIPNALPV